jgi:hypothetical protein
VWISARPECSAHREERILSHWFSVLHVMGTLVFTFSFPSRSALHLGRGSVIVAPIGSVGDSIAPNEENGHAYDRPDDAS